MKTGPGILTALVGLLLTAPPSRVEARLFKIVEVQEKARFLAPLDRPVPEDPTRASDEPQYDDAQYYVDAGREQGIDLNSLFNVYRYIYIDDPGSEATTRMKVLIGTLEVVAVDEKLCLTRVVSTEPMRNLALDFKRFMVGDAAAPAIKLDSSVLFPSGKADLAPRAAVELQRAAKQILAANPKEISIAGHTDSAGDPKANYQLSLQRAETVRTFLIRQGVMEEKIKAVGYGDTRPVAPNDSEENRQKNRRIEVVFWE